MIGWLRLEAGRLTVRFAVLTAAMLLSFSWQSFVTQTHEHFALATSAAGSSAATHLTRERAPADSPATCPICRDAAATGSFLASTPMLTVPTIAVVAWIERAAPRASSRLQRSHAWQSRAPPAPPIR